jgi:hypothetical protein
MSNAARSNTRKTPRQNMRERPLGELKFTFRVAPPDGNIGPDGNPLPVDIVCDLREFTLAERQMVKRCMALLADPVDTQDVIIVHSWVMWRRIRPESSFQSWMDGITVGNTLDGLVLDPGHVEWDTTPVGYDPKASSTA